ncbi:MAG: S41 family peptidase [Oligoflexia bacterium]|nr:S41 family peptidase [Oligoflexia bacterium]MBF0365382.1 S41 family peptidase [Oligoflexia bacterium]
MPRHLFLALLLSFSLFFSLAKAQEEALPKSSDNAQNIPPTDNKSRFEHLELFNKVLFMIESQYYREVDIEKVVHGALKGMMETLDPHSSFLEKDYFSKMQDETNGEFGGLGIEVTLKDGIIYIVSAIDDTPAYKAGLKTGDKIIEIDHEPTLGLSLDEAVKKMKGASGTKAILGIAREGILGIKHFEVIREKIKTQPVKSELLFANIAFIRLTQFQKGSAVAIRKAIKNLRKESGDKLQGIILDLRSNPGGLLDEAVEVSSIFLKEGPVVSIEGRDGEKKDVRYATQAPEEEKELHIPVAVLINGSSASASEIVAGALQDYERALILGQQSFGKGSVQAVSQVDDDNGIKLTIAQYLTPKQRRIQALGITPDIELEEFDIDPTKDGIKIRYVREMDLKNHLNATIETPQEKELRLKKEKEDRKHRIQEIEERRKAKEHKNKRKENAESGDGNGDGAENDNILKKYSPKEDFQVVQAVNYLKSFSIFKNFLQGDSTQEILKTLNDKTPSPKAKSKTK